MNALTTTDDRPKRQIIEVQDPIPVLDTSRFEHMQRIANVMAQSTLIPESLYLVGKKDDKTELPLPQIISNCFLVVNQAVRWGLDPFAVAQSVAVVHGKLCYEGKLVAAVLDAKIGVRLHHHLVGAQGTDDYRIYLSDKPFNTEIEVKVGDEVRRGPLAEFLTPGFRHPAARLFDGSVGEWKTSGNNTPWTPKNQPRMLIYRGTRDWARIYEPAVMLGVYTPDELIDLEENARAQRARDVSQPSVLTRLQENAQNSPQEVQNAREGFSAAHVARETETLAGEPEIEQDAPPLDMGGGAGSGGTDALSEVSAAADQSATPAGGAEEEAGEIAKGETVSPDQEKGTEEPGPASSSASDRHEAIDRLLATATDTELVPDAEDRVGNLDMVTGYWLEKIGKEHKPFVDTLFKTAVKVARGELKLDAARKYLEGLV